ncbi:MAG TPA: hypothetical protein GX497_09855 [Bacillus bacterium]|nr:hypothetical protein [Bacillus sp. (in: firmicutes)]
MNAHERNSIEGQVLDKSFFYFDIGKPHTITSTIAINEEQLFAKILSQLEDLQNNKECSAEDLSAIYEQIMLLPDKSDLRLQCEFHYRNIKERILDEQNNVVKTKKVATNTNIVDMLKEENTNVLEEFLIQTKWEPFINLGAEGRKQIISKLIHNKDQVHREEAIIEFIKEETNQLQSLLAEILTTKDEKKLKKHLNQLNLQWFHNQSEQIKQFIIELVLKQTIPEDITVTKLDEFLKKVLKDANRVTTIPVDLIKNNNEVNESIL